MTVRQKRADIVIGGTNSYKYPTILQRKSKSKGQYPPKADLKASRAD